MTGRHHTVRRSRAVHDWNVVVTITDKHFRDAWDLLRPLGDVGRTYYYNVLVMKVVDITELMEAMRERMEYPDTVAAIARVAPVSDTFNFQSLEEFQSKAKDIAATYLPRLVGHSFHVRMHRRGWKGKIEAPVQERLVGEYLFEELEHSGTPSRIDFVDPDVIVAIETLNNRAGLAFWTRASLQRYPFLKLD
jgi:tRNA(Ser,Leu) C12 N-acetylase TAN1